MYRKFFKNEGMYKKFFQDEGMYWKLFQNEGMYWKFVHYEEMYWNLIQNEEMYWNCIKMKESITNSSKIKKLYSKMFQIAKKYWKLFETENTRTVTEHGQLATRPMLMSEFEETLQNKCFIIKQMKKQQKLNFHDTPKHEATKSSNSGHRKKNQLSVLSLRNLTGPLMRARDNIDIIGVVGPIRDMFFYWSYQSHRSQH